VPTLKADLHCHVSGDPRDDIGYTAEDLIDRAVGLGFDAIAITNHREVWQNPGMIAYAQKRGLLVIPGIELDVEGKHVVMINVDKRVEAIRSFDDIRSSASSDRVVIAPHPFYPLQTCIGKKLVEHVDVFDAIEYSFFYCRVLNPNARAEAVANRAGLPMVGSSDCHSLRWLGRTYTVIEADKKDVKSVVHAIHEGCASVVTRPLSMPTFAAACARSAVNMCI